MAKKNTEPMDVVIGIRFCREHLDILKGLAKERGLTVSALVRMWAISNMMDEVYREPRPSKKKKRRK